MIWVICNVQTGDLLQISEAPLSASGHPLMVKTFDMPMPDLTKVEWERSGLEFKAKLTRRLTKLDFIGRLGDPAFSKLLELSLTSVEILKFVKLIDWTTPDADGTSIDLDDLRVQKVRDLEPLLLSLGVSGVTPGWADGVLA